MCYNDTVKSWIQNFFIWHWQFVHRITLFYNIFIDAPKIIGAFCINMMYNGFIKYLLRSGEI